MPTILSIEVATAAGSISISQGSELIYSGKCGSSTESLSKTLLPSIDTALQISGLSMNQIDLFAATTGPGSFTGLRIGLATIKALAATLDKPCASVPSLHAIALSTYPTGIINDIQWIIPLLRAGRGEVFVQSLTVGEEATGGENSVTELSPPLHLPLSRVLEQVALKKSSVLFAGPAAIELAEEIEAFAGAESIDFVREKDFHSSQQGQQEQQGWQGINWILAEEMRGNLSDYVAKIAFKIYQMQNCDGAEDVQAIYVRPSDPELKDRIAAGRVDARTL